MQPRDNLASWKSTEDLYTHAVGRDTKFPKKIRLGQLALTYKPWEATAQHRRNAVTPALICPLLTGLYSTSVRGYETET